MRLRSIIIALVLLLICGAAYAVTAEPEFIESYAQLFGHPVHPMLVVFPLALFITSLVFDIIYAVRKDVFWHRAAYYLIAGGLIGGVLAAIPGFLDYFLAIPEGSHADEVAELHWAIMLVVMGLFLVNLIIRSVTDTQAHGKFWLVTLLSVAGICVMLVGAWYGGHLVYEHRVGVQAEMHHHEEPQSPADYNHEHEEGHENDHEH